MARGGSAERLRGLKSLTVTWIGAGSLFAWGLWTLIFVLSGITFGRRAEDGMALYNCPSFVKFTAGMRIGIVTVILLVERQAPRTPSTASRGGR